MIKLTTPVGIPPSLVKISLKDKIVLLGSCFADAVGAKMLSAGYDALVNPFGTLYNPLSIYNAAARLGSALPFTEKDCVQMGAGAGLFCSFSHHSSFAAPGREEFLAGANASLEKASAFWKDAGKVFITLGTSMIWKRLDSGETVANCLKRPASEFSHEMLSCGQISAILRALVQSNPGKEFIFSVSPIRYLSEGARSNTLSKARLHLALEEIGAEYFPACEILLDELRDYRFYAEDLVHPSKVAEEIIWRRFLETYALPDESEAVSANEKAARRAAHRPLRK